MRAELAATKNKSRSSHKAALCPMQQCQCSLQAAQLQTRPWGTARARLPRGRAGPSVLQHWDGLQGHGLWRMHGSWKKTGLAESKPEVTQERKLITAETWQAATLGWVLEGKMLTEHGRQTIGNKFPFHLLTCKCLKIHHGQGVSRSPVAVNTQQDIQKADRH